MPIVGRPAQIQDLPLNSIDDQVPCAVYCLLLSMSPINAQFYQMRVTDFTKHPYLKTQYDERILSEYFIDKDRIASIDIHKSKWRSAVNAAREQFSGDFEQPVDSVKLINELVFCKLTLKSKSYNNVLEPRVMYIEFVGRNCNEDNYLKLLDSVLSDLPFSFVMSQRDKFKQRFPPSILAKWESIIESRERSLRSVTQLESQVKVEAGDTSRSLAIEFSDLEVSDEELNIVENQWRPKRRHSNPIYPLKRINGPKNNKVTEQISILNLKRLEECEVNGHYFLINGQIVETFPQNWSYVCVKSYVGVNSTYEFSDPMLREVELIIADKEGFFLNIWLDKNQLLSLFGKLVEVIFCEASKTVPMLFKDHEFEVVRCRRKIGNSLVPTWTFTDPCLKQLRNELIGISDEGT